MKISEIIVEERVLSKKRLQDVRRLLESVNAKIRNLSENTMPALPSQKVWQDKITHKDEWIKYKRSLREYQMKYNDGTEHGKIKMCSLPKFISEHYANLREDVDKIEEIVKRAFSGCVPATQLEVGKKYDVAVVRLDHITKTLEVDIIHSQTVSSVRHRKMENEWIVTTSGGLSGPTSVSNISEQIETLYFDNSNKLGTVLRHLEVIMTPDYKGWNLSVLSDDDSQKNEDATTTPGGVGSATKMFLEAEDEPRVREYEDSFGRKRWEVLDWRGVRKIAFDSRGRAHEYLNKNKDDLSHPDGPLKESSPKWQEHQSPRQRTGVKVWHEIDRAYRQQSKNPDDPLRSAVLKFFDGSSRVLSRAEVESIWSWLKEFFRDQKNQRNQLQVYDALSTDRGIEQILAMTGKKVMEDADSAKVWMIEYIPDSEKRKEAINRQTKRLFYRNEGDAQVAFSKLSKSTHDLVSRMPMQISARGVPQQWIR